jgi:uncharacterized membrane protein
MANARLRPRLQLAGLAAIPVLFHLAIFETRHVPLALVPRFGPLLKLGFVTSSALAHWAIYSSLLVMFALTLRPGREPLITAMARRLHGTLPDELARYTRRVTLAWSCFFAAQLTSSIALFLFAPLVVWSFFVNILDLPLVAAMFAAEYATRLRVLRNPPRHSLAVILAMVADIRKPQEEPAGSL